MTPKYSYTTNKTKVYGEKQSERKTRIEIKMCAFYEIKLN